MLFVSLAGVSCLSGSEGSCRGCGEGRAGRIWAASWVGEVWVLFFVEGLSDRGGGWWAYVQEDGAVEGFVV